MSEQGVTYRIIDGERCRCVDVGCPDFKRAAQNRYIVKHKLFTTFWHRLEDWLAHTPLWAPLPKWIPRGSLPQVGKSRREYRELRSGGFSSDITREQDVEDLTDPPIGEYNNNEEK